MFTKKFECLIDVLAARAGQDAIGVTLINDGNEETFLSYHDLYEKALCLLYGFQKNGVNPGDEMILYIEDNRQFIIVFWTCILGGFIPVPVTAGFHDNHRKKITKIIEILKMPYLVSSDGHLEDLRKFASENNKEELSKLIRTRSLCLNDDYSKEFKGIINHFVRPDDVAFIQFSSGSTGDPKGVMLTHRNLMHNACGILNRIEINKKDSFFAWIPLTHDMGLIGFHITPIIAGINHYVMPTSTFIRNPVLWIKKVNEYGCTILSSPNFGYQYFLKYYIRDSRSGVVNNWNLSKVRVIFNGAEPISPQICDEFLGTLSQYKLRRTTMFTVYGLAEASVAVTIPDKGWEFETLHLNRGRLNIGEKVEDVPCDDNEKLSFVKLGKAVDYCQVRICNKDNQVLNEDIIGDVQIKGCNVTQGYYNNPEATGRLFTDDGWLYTGDLGFMRDGCLIITGRAKDIIFVNGQNIYPHDIEWVAEKIKEVSRTVACGIFNEHLQKEEIVLFVQFRGNVEKFAPLAGKVKRHLNKTGGWFVKDVLPVKQIPKTTSGKVKRYELSKYYLNGQFSELSEKLKTLMDLIIDAD